MTLLYFIIVLGILVLIHEWGHFIVARRSGIKVEVFSIGFGPKIFSYQGKVTEYRVAIIPLGGYVKLFGEDPVAEAEGDEEKAKEIAESPEAFSTKSLKARIATVLAGPGMNLIFCVLLMPLVFWIGRDLPQYLGEAPVVQNIVAESPAAQSDLQVGDRIVKIDDRPMQHWEDVLNWIIVHANHQANFTVDRNGTEVVVPLKTTFRPCSDRDIGYIGTEPSLLTSPQIGQVAPDSPAEKAGLQSGDLVVAIDKNPVGTWMGMTTHVCDNGGTPIEIQYKRGDQTLTTTLTPKYNDMTKTWIIGVSKNNDTIKMAKRSYSFGKSVELGLQESWKLFVMTGDVFARLFTLQLSYKSLGGPVEIASASGAAARSGLGSFLYFMALLSLNLGVLNLLPIPVLDGGHLLFMVIEGIRKKPVSLRVRTIATQIGLIFLLGLMVVITFNDIDRLWGISGLIEKVIGIF